MAINNKHLLYKQQQTKIWGENELGLHKIDKIKRTLK